MTGAGSVEVEDAPPAEEHAGSHWDALIEHMRTYRESVGSPSFRVLAERVAAARVARGIDPYAARVGKTTVYDCFQLGRARVNLDLVREVARAMGASDDDVDAWINSCHKSLVVEDEGPDPVEVVRLPSRMHVLVLMLAGLALNLIGRGFVLFLDFPLHLDMMGTAVVAIALGPWRGAAVGASTGVVGMGLSGSSSLTFGLVNVAGALAWGYGVRWFRGGASIPRFVALNLFTALVCSLAAVPILLGFYGGVETRHSFGDVTASFDALWSSHAASVFVANYVTSALDKMLSGFVALAAIASLPLVLRPRLPIVATQNQDQV
jgi:energy-coupling factor transport system substrate-specific component